MSAEKKAFSSIVSLIALVLLVSGCDKLSVFTDRFQSKGKPQPIVAAVKEPAVQPSAPAPAAPKTPAQPASNTLAQVGNWTMTIEEFKERLTALKQVVPDYDEKDPQAKRFVLDELVRQELLVQDAERKGVAEKKEIKNAVEEFRRTLLVREMAMKITQGIQATEEDAKAYYEENKADFISPGRWHIREMVFDTEEVAKTALIELYKGADFAQMAQQQSIAESKDKGGDLGFIETFEFSSMDNAVKALEPGGISSVFKGPKGFYVIKLEEREGGESQEFEKIKEEIKSGLALLKQQQAILAYLEDLQRATNVYINEKLLGE